LDDNTIVAEIDRITNQVTEAFVVIAMSSILQFYYHRGNDCAMYREHWFKYQDQHGTWSDIKADFIITSKQRQVKKVKIIVGEAKRQGYLNTQ
jgi:hypothetical protein